MNACMHAVYMRNMGGSRKHMCARGRVCRGQDRIHALHQNGHASCLQGCWTEWVPEGTVVPQHPSLKARASSQNHNIGGL